MGMKKIADYITPSEFLDFCAGCNEICSRHCAIMRKAEFRYDEEERNGKKQRSAAPSAEEV